MDEKKGADILRDSRLSKSVAFTRAEREQFGIRGLLPYAVSTQEIQVKRVLANMRRKANDIERYIFLMALEDRNERLFYRVLQENIVELLPIVYTPTVGQACSEYSHIFRKEKGFYITPEDRGRMGELFENWPDKDIRIIVVTDGQRILGLGDLGSNGMGIPIGKLSLYVAGAGIQPDQCLPIMLDVGTNNANLREDPLYLGYPYQRLEGEEYLAFVDEFIKVVKEKYPKVLIQFEDFLTPNAYRLLNRYRDDLLCFNDDIQGTASVAVAGILASEKITGIPLRDSKVMFLGAGSAATGIADLMVLALQADGLSEEEARKRLWFVDIDGLVVKDRTSLQPHNLPYAHEESEMDFLAAIKKIRPDILIGASGAGGTFTKQVIEKMAEINERPVIFALSNPTSNSECTAEQAYHWSAGRAVFASGSPFSEVYLDEQHFVPGQGNNAYIFPGIGLGAIIGDAVTLPESVFLAAAEALAEQVSETNINEGTLYPGLEKIKFISVRIASAVVRHLESLGLTQAEIPEDLESAIWAYMYDPGY